MGRTLDELIEDVNEYVLGRRGLRDRWLALKQKMRTLPSSFKNRLSEKQRELLVQATMIENPRSVWDLLKGLPVSKDVWIEEHQAYPYFVAIKSLVSQGLFEEILNETYSLTRKGWKKAVLVRKGKYDPRTDISGKLTEYP